MRKTSLGGEESQHRLCQGWVTAVGKWGSTLEEPQSTSLSRVAGKGRGAFSHQVGASLAGVASGVCTRPPLRLRAWAEWPSTASEKAQKQKSRGVGMGGVRGGPSRRRPTATPKSAGPEAAGREPKVSVACQVLAGSLSARFHHRVYEPGVRRAKRSEGDPSPLVGFTAGSKGSLGPCSGTPHPGVGIQGGSLEREFFDTAVVLF